MASKKFTFILTFFFKIYLTYANYVATLSGCPGSYQRIANGCYFIMNLTQVTRDTADSLCRVNYSAPSPVVTHLLSIESQAESIAISIWFQGFKYSASFWTDGTRDSANKRVWSWSMQDYTSFGYFKDSALANRKYMYLMYNTTGFYEFRDDDGFSGFGYICEAQVPCQTSENVCFNNGSCWVNNGRVLCTCQPGFIGELCEQQVDNCDSVPCLHGGDCYNLVNNYTCNCTKYYKGRNCETEIPYEYESVITAVLWISFTIVALVLGSLSLMDVPWSSMIKVWKKKRAAKQVKEASAPPYMETSMDDRSKMPTKAQLLASEQEMLKRFRSALEQAKREPASRMKNF